MDPANLLFIIAFIGLPIAFGIWAIVSRRELKRRPPVADDRPHVPRSQDPAGQPPPAPRRRKRRVRQMGRAVPSAQQAPPNWPQPAEQPTMQAPAVQQEQRPPEPVNPDPAPPASAAPVDYGPSGTTQEFPVIADGMMPPAEPPPPEQETVLIPAHIPADRLAVAAMAPPPAAPEPEQPAPAPPPVPAQAPPTVPPSYGPPVRRRYYPVRYAAPSKGVVKRMTPLDERIFVRGPRT